MHHRHSGESRNPAHRSSVRWAPAFAGATAWETILVPLVCIAYLAAVVVIHPEYFHLVREVGWAYSRFLRNSVWITTLQGHGSAIVLGAVIVALALRDIPKEAATWRVLIGTMLGYFLAAVFQAKGWRYHLYPAIGLAVLLFATMAWDARPMEARGIMRLFADLPISTLITTALVGGVLAAAQLTTPGAPRYDADPNLHDLVPVVQARAAGRPVYVLSANMASSFPLVTYAHAKWPGRLPHLWPAVVAYDSAIRQPGSIEFRPIDGITTIERFGLETTVQDFIRSRAPLVVTLIPVDQWGWGQQRVDVLRFMLRDSRFRAAWMDYDSLGQVGDYLVWARRGDSLAARPLPHAAYQRSADTSPPDLPRVNPYALFAGGVLVVVLGCRQLACHGGSA